MNKETTVKAIRLQTETLTAPLDLGNAKPRFSWNCAGGKKQTAYRIVCIRGSETVWDSGMPKKQELYFPLRTQVRLFGHATYLPCTKAKEIVSAASDPPFGA